MTVPLRAALDLRVSTARQAETGCKGRSIPMEKLDNLVAEHVADRLLQPGQLEEILASVLDRRQERAERRREHIAELNKRAAETDLRLKRLYDAIEAGIADLDDQALKERIASLKAIRFDGGGYRRDHLRALAQRVEVADREVRIIGSKSNLLQTLTAAAGEKSATPGVRRSVLKWRRGRDSNPGYP